jgi:hypothetical protein
MAACRVYRENDNSIVAVRKFLNHKNINVTAGYLEGLGLKVDI